MHFKRPKYGRKEIEALREEYLDRLDLLPNDIADFFILHIVEGVKRAKAWDMTHDIQENPDAMHPETARRQTLNRESLRAVEREDFASAKRAWYSYKTAKSENIGDILLETSLAIIQADMSKTTYEHPTNGRTVTRSPQQLGLNERLAALEMTSHRGNTRYRMESKIGAMRVAMDLLGLKHPEEHNHHLDGGTERVIRIGYTDPEAIKEEEEEQDDGDREEEDML